MNITCHIRYNGSFVVSAFVKYQGEGVKGYKHTKQRELKYDLKEAISLYESGLSLVTVGERLGVTSGAIRHQLIKNGIRIRTSNEVVESKRPKYDDEEIASLYKTGLTYSQVANKVGRGTWVVTRAIKKQDARRKGVNGKKVSVATIKSRKLFGFTKKDIPPN